MPIESANPCHYAQVVMLYLVSSPVCLTVLAAKSEDFTTASQQLRISKYYFLALAATFIVKVSCRVSKFLDLAFELRKGRNHR